MNRVESFVDRAALIYGTPTGQKVLRYTLVSIVATVVYLGLIALLFGVLHIWSEVPTVIFANAVATVPSYTLNRKWVWGKTGRSHFLKEVIPFWVTSFAGVVLAMFAAALARNFSNSHQLHQFGRTIVVMGAALTAAAALWTGRFLLFNRLFRQAHNVERDLVGPSSD